MVILKRQINDDDDDDKGRNIFPPVAWILNELLRIKRSAG